MNCIAYLYRYVEDESNTLHNNCCLRQHILKFDLVGLRPTWVGKSRLFKVASFIKLSNLQAISTYYKFRSTYINKAL